MRTCHGYFIQDLLSRIAWSPYDWLLVDTAPSISQENEAILKNLDPEVVVVVAEPGDLAREGVVPTASFSRRCGQSSWASWGTRR